MPLQHKWIENIFTCHYLRLDHWGRMVFDMCKTDPEHLTHPKQEDGERSQCRRLLTQLLPADWIGRKGHWKVTIEFEPEENTDVRQG